MLTDQEGRKNCCGLPQFHLRRIGPPATKPGVADVMDFHGIITLIGRNHHRVDYLLDSSTENTRLYISRVHARVVIQADSTGSQKIVLQEADACTNNHRLHDDSLNGVFINNIKIAGSVVLREGDRVTFGHPQGEKIAPGTRVRQPDSEYQFMFERCNCPSDAPSNHNDDDKKLFAVPKLTGSNSKFKRDRNATRTFTQTDCQNLKKEYEGKVKMDLGDHRVEDEAGTSASRRATTSDCSSTLTTSADVGTDTLTADQVKLMDESDSVVKTEGSNGRVLESENISDNSSSSRVHKNELALENKVSPKKDTGVQTLHKDTVVMETTSPHKDAAIQTCSYASDAMYELLHGAEDGNSCQIGTTHPQFGISSHQSGTTQREDGNLPHTSGTLRPEDVNSPHQNGDTQPESGNLPHTSGTLQPEGGNSPHQNGDTQPESGNLPHTSGTLQPEGGNSPHQNGDTQPESGHLPHTCGTLQPEGGNSPHQNGDTQPESGHLPHTCGTLQLEGGNSPHQNGDTQPESGNSLHQSGTTHPEGGNSQWHSGTFQAEGGNSPHQIGKSLHQSGESRNSQHPSGSLEPECGNFPHHTGILQPEGGNFSHQNGTTEGGNSLHHIGTTQPEGGNSSHQNGTTQPEGGNSPHHIGTLQLEGGNSSHQKGTTQPEGENSSHWNITTQPEGENSSHHNGTTQPEGGNSSHHNGTTQPEGGNSPHHSGKLQSEPLVLVSERSYENGIPGDFTATEETGSDRECENDGSLLPAHQMELEVQYRAENTNNDMQTERTSVLEQESIQVSSQPEANDISGELNLELSKIQDNGEPLHDGVNDNDKTVGKNDDIAANNLDNVTTAYKEQQLDSGKQSTEKMLNLKCNVESSCDAVKNNCYGVVSYNEAEVEQNVNQEMVVDMVGLVEDKTCESVMETNVAEDRKDFASEPTVDGCVTDKLKAGAVEGISSENGEISEELLNKAYDTFLANEEVDTAFRNKNLDTPVNRQVAEQPYDHGSNNPVSLEMEDADDSNETEDESKSQKDGNGLVYSNSIEYFEEENQNESSDGDNLSDADSELLLEPNDNQYIEAGFGSEADSELLREPKDNQCIEAGYGSEADSELLLEPKDNQYIEAGYESDADVGNKMKCQELFCEEKIDLQGSTNKEVNGAVYPDIEIEAQDMVDHRGNENGNSEVMENNLSDEVASSVANDKKEKENGDVVSSTDVKTLSDKTAFAKPFSIRDLQGEPDELITKNGNDGSDEIMDDSVKPSNDQSKKNTSRLDDGDNGCDRDSYVSLLNTDTTVKEGSGIQDSRDLDKCQPSDGKVDKESGETQSGEVNINLPNELGSTLPNTTSSKVAIFSEASYIPNNGSDESDSSEPNPCLPRNEGAHKHSEHDPLEAITSPPSKECSQQNMLGRLSDKGEKDNGNLETAIIGKSNLSLNDLEHDKQSKEIGTEQVVKFGSHKELDVAGKEPGNVDTSATKINQESILKEKGSHEELDNKNLKLNPEQQVDNIICVAQDLKDSHNSADSTGIKMMTEKVDHTFGKCKVGDHTEIGFGTGPVELGVAQKCDLSLQAGDVDCTCKSVDSDINSRGLAKADEVVKNLENVTEKEADTRISAVAGDMEGVSSAVADKRLANDLAPDGKRIITDPLEVCPNNSEENNMESESVSEDFKEEFCGTSATVKTKLVEMTEHCVVSQVVTGEDELVPNTVDSQLQKSEEKHCINKSDLPHLNALQQSPDKNSIPNMTGHIDIYPENLSPISKNIATLQDFAQTQGSTPKGNMEGKLLTDSDNNVPEFISPASKKRRDKEHIDEMMQCLEDSISSAGEETLDNSESIDFADQRTPLMFGQDTVDQSINSPFRKPDRRVFSMNKIENGKYADLNRFVQKEDIDKEQSINFNVALSSTPNKWSHEDKLPSLDTMLDVNGGDKFFVSDEEKNNYVIKADWSKDEADHKPAGTSSIDSIDQDVTETSVDIMANDQNGTSGSLSIDIDDQDITGLLLVKSKHEVLGDHRNDMDQDLTETSLNIYDGLKQESFQEITVSLSEDLMDQNNAEVTIASENKKLGNNQEDENLSFYDEDLEQDATNNDSKLSTNDVRSIEQQDMTASFSDVTNCQDATASCDNSDNNSEHEDTRTKHSKDTVDEDITKSAKSQDSLKGDDFELTRTLYSDDFSEKDTSIVQSDDAVNCDNEKLQTTLTDDIIGQNSMQVGSHDDVQNMNSEWNSPVPDNAVGGDGIETSFQAVDDMTCNISQDKMMDTLYPDYNKGENASESVKRVGNFETIQVLSCDVISIKDVAKSSDCSVGNRSDNSQSKRSETSLPGVNDQAASDTCKCANEDNKSEYARAALSNDTRGVTAQSIDTPGVTAQSNDTKGVTESFDRPVVDLNYSTRERGGRMSRLCVVKATDMVKCNAQEETTGTSTSEASLRLDVNFTNVSSQHESSSHTDNSSKDESQCEKDKSLHSSDDIDIQNLTVYANDANIDEVTQTSFLDRDSSAIVTCPSVSESRNNDKITSENSGERSENGPLSGIRSGTDNVSELPVEMTSPSLNIIPMSTLATKEVVVEEIDAVTAPSLSECSVQAQEVANKSSAKVVVLPHQEKPGDYTKEMNGQSQASVLSYIGEKVKLNNDTVNIYENSLSDTTCVVKEKHSGKEIELEKTCLLSSDSKLAEDVICSKDGSCVSEAAKSPSNSTCEKWKLCGKEILEKTCILSSDPQEEVSPEDSSLRGMADPEKVIVEEVKNEMERENCQIACSTQPNEVISRNGNYVSLEIGEKDLQPNGEGAVSHLEMTNVTADNANISFDKVDRIRLSQPVDAGSSPFTKLASKMEENNSRPEHIEIDVIPSGKLIDSELVDKQNVMDIIKDHNGNENIYGMNETELKIVSVCSGRDYDKLLSDHVMLEVKGHLKHPTVDKTVSLQDKTDGESCRTKRNTSVCSAILPMGQMSDCVQTEGAKVEKLFHQVTDHSEEICLQSQNENLILIETGDTKSASQSSEGINSEMIVGKDREVTKDVFSGLTQSSGSLGSQGSDLIYTWDVDTTKLEGRSCDRSCGNFTQTSSVSMDSGSDFFSDSNNSIVPKPRKRKRRGSGDTAETGERKKPKLHWAQHAETILSNFFRIREIVEMQKNACDKQTLRKTLIGKIVTRFFSLRKQNALGLSSCKTVENCDDSLCDIKVCNPSNSIGCIVGEGSQTQSSHEVPKAANENICDNSSGTLDWNSHLENVVELAKCAKYLKTDCDTDNVVSECVEQRQQPSVLGAEFTESVKQISVEIESSAFCVADGISTSTLPSDSNANVDHVENSRNNKELADQSKAGGHMNIKLCIDQNMDMESSRNAKFNMDMLSNGNTELNRNMLIFEQSRSGDDKSMNRLSVYDEKCDQNLQTTSAGKKVDGGLEEGVSNGGLEEGVSDGGLDGLSDVGIPDHAVDDSCLVYSDSDCKSSCDNDDEKIVDSDKDIESEISQTRNKWDFLERNSDKSSGNSDSLKDISEKCEKYIVEENAENVVGIIYSRDGNSEKSANKEITVECCQGADKEVTESRDCSVGNEDDSADISIVTFSSEGSGDNSDQYSSQDFLVCGEDDERCSDDDAFSEKIEKDEFCKMKSDRSISSDECHVNSSQENHMLLSHEGHVNSSKENHLLLSEDYHVILPDGNGEHNQEEPGFKSADTQESDFSENSLQAYDYISYVGTINEPDSCDGLKTAVSKVKKADNICNSSLRDSAGTDESESILGTYDESYNKSDREMAEIERSVVVCHPLSNSSNIDRKESKLELHSEENSVSSDGETVRMKLNKQKKLGGAAEDSSNMDSEEMSENILEGNAFEISVNVNTSDNEEDHDETLTGVCEADKSENGERSRSRKFRVGGLIRDGGLKDIASGQISAGAQDAKSDLGNHAETTVSNDNNRISSMDDQNSTEQNNQGSSQGRDTEETDLSSINYCPLPDLDLCEVSDDLSTPEVKHLKVHLPELNTKVTDCSFIDHCLLPNLDAGDASDDYGMSEVKDTKLMLPKLHMSGEIYITESSDELPEVFFLKEDNDTKPLVGTKVKQEVVNCDRGSSSEVNESNYTKILNSPRRSPRNKKNTEMTRPLCLNNFSRNDYQKKKKSNQTFDTLGNENSKNVGSKGTKTTVSKTPRRRPLRKRKTVEKQKTYKKSRCVYSDEEIEIFDVDSSSSEDDNRNIKKSCVPQHGIYPGLKVREIGESSKGKPSENKGGDWVMEPVECSLAESKSDTGSVQDIFDSEEFKDSLQPDCDVDLPDNDEGEVESSDEAYDDVGEQSPIKIPVEDSHQEIHNKHDKQKDFNQSDDDDNDKDEDYIQNTCGEESDDFEEEMSVPALIPRQVSDQVSQSLSPVIPAVSTVSKQTATDASSKKGFPVLFDDSDTEEDIHAPDIDWEALESDNTKNDSVARDNESVGGSVLRTRDRSSPKPSCSKMGSDNDDDLEPAPSSDGESVLYARDWSSHKPLCSKMGSDNNDDLDLAPFLKRNNDSGDDDVVEVSLANKQKTDVTAPYFSPKSNSISKHRKRKLFENDNDEDIFSSPLKKIKKKQSKLNFTTTKTPTKKIETFDLDMEVSTQCDAVQLSNTQFEKSACQLLADTSKDKEASSKRKRAKELIANLRAKRMRSKSGEGSLQGNASLHVGQEMPGETTQNGSLRPRRILPEVQATNDRIDGYLTRCKTLLDTLRQALSQDSGVQDIPRVIQWKKDLLELEQKTHKPRTVIAVVGDTGEGKSSLMNALIDQRNALPTSGMQACTAVVVEIKSNDTRSDFEADIKFLSRKEWNDELQLLLKDLTTADGQIKKGVPDPDTEAGIAYLKVRAVYGKVSNFQTLSRQTTVTRWLDQTRTLRSSDPDEFHTMIDRYIENKEKIDQSSSGGEFWPIVKMVTIRLPNCDAVSSGAVLVDLPGVRDSNAARDKIAKDYLKECTAVWVVASIHRAVNNKTAKEMLGENFRRQLLMDGQYGSVAFICTKSDFLNPSELIRNLDLKDACEPFKNEIRALQMEKDEAIAIIDNSKQEIRKTKRMIKEMHKEIEETEGDLQEAQSILQDSEGNLDPDSEGMEELEPLKQEIREKEQEIQRMQGEITELEVKRDEAVRKSLEKEEQIGERRRQIAGICAEARNKYSMTQIKRDFKAGLKEMKRKSGLNETDDETDDYDDYNSDDDDVEVGSSADNLKVFCVSSTEYQKMKKLITDGPPMVFKTEEETQIPRLREYIHEMTSIRRTQSAERLIRSLGRFIFDMQGYLMDDGTSCKGTRMDAKSAIEAHSRELQSKLQPVVDKFSNDIQEVLSKSIEPKLREGVCLASSEATDISAKWGDKPNRENRKEGGLHWMTYRCTVRRQGVYNSKTYGPIDFNEQLSEPMYRCISISWDKVFSGLLWQQMEICRSLLHVTLRKFAAELCQELQQLGVPADRVNRVAHQLVLSSADKLTEMVTVLKEMVMSRQRDISRVLVPSVQENMDPTYANCSCECGQGMFSRMKDIMAEGVSSQKLMMFDFASRKLLTELITLKDDIAGHVSAVCLSLCNMLQSSFEPIWEAPNNSRRMRDILNKDIKRACDEIKQLFIEANIPLPVALPNVAQSDPEQPDTSNPDHSNQVPSPASYVTVLASRISPSRAESRNPTISTGSNLPTFVVMPQGLKQEEIEREEKTRAEKEAERRRKEKEKERVQKLKEEEKEQKKKEKYEQMKKDKINFLQTETKLVQMDNEIKKCVRKDFTDVDKCLAIMDDLNALPVNQVMLKKNQDIMKNIKMIRKFKGSEKIRNKAEVIYHKFKGFFLQDDNMDIGTPRETGDSGREQTLFREGTQPPAVRPAQIKNEPGIHNPSPTNVTIKQEHSAVQVKQEVTESSRFYGDPKLAVVQQKEASGEIPLPKEPKKDIQWIVDHHFRQEQERQKIPSDPRQWSKAHVYHWIKWAIKELGLMRVNPDSFWITGEQLCKLSHAEFIRLVHSDKGDVFWTHLELLRKCQLVCKFVAIKPKPNAVTKAFTPGAIVYPLVMPMSKQINLQPSTGQPKQGTSHLVSQVKIIPANQLSDLTSGTSKPFSPALTLSSLDRSVGNCQEQSRTAASGSQPLTYSHARPDMRKLSPSLNDPSGYVNSSATVVKAQSTLSNPSITVNASANIINTQSTLNNPSRSSNSSVNVHNVQSAQQGRMPYQESDNAQMTTPQMPMKRPGQSKDDTAKENLIEHMFQNLETVARKTILSKTCQNTNVSITESVTRPTDNKNTISKPKSKVKDSLRSLVASDSKIGRLKSPFKKTITNDRIQKYMETENIHTPERCLLSSPKRSTMPSSSSPQSSQSQKSRISRLSLRKNNSPVCGRLSVTVKTEPMDCDSAMQKVPRTDLGMIDLTCDSDST